MKIKPVAAALDARGVEIVLVHTGQHYDRSMSDVFFAELGLRTPDHYLGVGSGSHAQQTAAVMVSLEPLIERTDPNVVIVVGDVNSTAAAALVAAKARVMLGHVEAGLRSGDRSMPEELNRIVTDHLSDHLFATSAHAVENLRREGVSESQIHLVGNVMIDTLLANLDRARSRPVLRDLSLVAGDYGLVTLHRPSNVDEPGTLKGLLDALGAIAIDCPLVFPAHPRTAQQLETASIPPGIQVVDPLGYLDFLCLEASARLVLTDSGGVQEETTALGVPCLTVRDNTERPETVSEGTNTVVGRDPEAIVRVGRETLRKEVTARRPPLWDGHAADRIADVLVQDGR